MSKEKQKKQGVIDPVKAGKNKNKKLRRGKEDPIVIEEKSFSERDHGRRNTDPEIDISPGTV